MTEKELRQKFVSAAVSYIGCKESNGSHKQIIDLYNTIKPLPRGYKVKYTDDWCATFVSAMAVKCGLGAIIPQECSCEKQIELFQRMGAWIENDAYTPSAGDIIYYDWQDSGAGDNKGWSDHVGIVVSSNADTIKVIEGNNGDAVNYRSIAINGRYIRGFGVPDFKSLAVENETEAAKKWSIENGFIKGYKDGNFGWKDTVTREQLAIILYRMQKK